MSRTKVWAHRGASAYAPENTIVSFQKAIDMKADGIELDVQMTKDGELVVIHDETIDRTSNGKGWVKDYTLEELRKFNYNRTCPEVEYAGIPTLREVYDLMKPTKLSINVELKTGIVFYKDIEEKVLALTEEMGLRRRVIYSSFNHYTILNIKKLEPLAMTGFLYADGFINMPKYGKQYEVDALHPALYNLQFPGFIKKCKKNNLHLHVWTVNEKKYMKKLCEKGIDAIITNYPDVARNVVKKYQNEQKDETDKKPETDKKSEKAKKSEKKQGKKHDKK